MAVLQLSIRYHRIKLNFHPPLPPCPPATSIMSVFYDSWLATSGGRFPNGPTHRGIPDTVACSGHALRQHTGFSWQRPRKNNDLPRFPGNIRATFGNYLLGGEPGRKEGANLATVMHVRLTSYFGFVYRSGSFTSSLAVTDEPLSFVKVAQRLHRRTQ